ncbi:hypothetical protein FVR03_09645 [Pontibacter qinzhouensis]|uniref:Uncharacterized protein n=1 Tax=Pontibacter qinzhouensis TaxID=2603253 RepID=A0A5C8K9J1_9BACT|nr:hypothetical protein [Pontibacter qinzhouensis]TXK47449.1 hypothetical protein FVR03_09645 [Pontibacter qinzhouensis]
MHNEEDDHRNHQERWQQGSRNRRPRPANQEHFNDFSSRWNDDVPPLHSTRNDMLDERRRLKNDQDRFDQRQEHPDQQRDEYEQWYQNRYRQQQDPRHQQQDENFNRNNQFAKDRWHQDDYILREEELRRRYNRQFRDWEEEDRRRRRD